MDENQNKEQPNEEEIKKAEEQEAGRKPPLPTSVELLVIKFMTQQAKQNQVEELKMQQEK